MNVRCVDCGHDPEAHIRHPRGLACGACDCSKYKFAWPLVLAFTAVVALIIAAGIAAAGGIALAVINVTR